MYPRFLMSSSEAALALLGHAGSINRATANEARDIRGPSANERRVLKGAVIVPPSQSLGVDQCTLNTVDDGAVQQGECHDPDLPTNAGPAGCYTERERSGRCLHFEHARAPCVRIERGAFR